jgi:hypothetical protein
MDENNDIKFIELKHKIIEFLLNIEDQTKMNNYLLQLQTILDSFEKNNFN